MAPLDHAHAARVALAAAGRAESTRVRGLHVGLAAVEVAALTEELAALRLHLAAAQNELLRLHDAEAKTDT